MSNRKKKGLFNKVKPQCEYCARGRQTTKKEIILCLYKGAVPSYFACRRFVYDPTRRVPRMTPALAEYSAEDFDINS